MRMRSLTSFCCEVWGQSFGALAVSFAKRWKIPRSSTIIHSPLFMHRSLHKLGTWTNSWCHWNRILKMGKVWGLSTPLNECEWNFWESKISTGLFKFPATLHLQWFDLIQDSSNALISSHIFEFFKYCAFFPKNRNAWHSPKSYSNFRRKLGDLSFLVLKSGKEDSFFYSREWKPAVGVKNWRSDSFSPILADQTIWRHLRQCL